MKVDIFRFERNFYFETFQDHQQFNNDEELFDFVKAPPKFHYNNAANYQDFSKKYTADGWLGRKVLAIPEGLEAVCKNLYISDIIYSNE